MFSLLLEGLLAAPDALQCLQFLVGLLLTLLVGLQGLPLVNRGPWGPLLLINNRKIAKKSVN